MKVKNTDDLNDNWQVNVYCQHTYCVRISTSRSRRLFALHNCTFHVGCTNERMYGTDERTHILPANKTLFNSIRKV